MTSLTLAPTKVLLVAISPEYDPPWSEPLGKVSRLDCDSTGVHLRGSLSLEQRNPADVPYFVVLMVATQEAQCVVFRATCQTFSFSFAKLTFAG